MMSSLSESVTLVMVEDDDGHALLIRKNLERAGVSNEIVHFTNGAQALTYFFNDSSKTAARQKSLVLLDLNLPEIDGYEVLRRLKENEGTRNIPVIVLTTTDNPREIDRCYQLGCNVYVSKPVEYEAFSDAIRKLGLMLAVVKIPHNQP
jgi:CheY-like chemotaxis protein